MGSCLAAGLVLLIVNWQAVSDFVVVCGTLLWKGAKGLWEDFVKELVGVHLRHRPVVLWKTHWAGTADFKFFAGLPQMILRHDL